MKRGLTFLMAGGLLWGVFASCAFAQRGMGEPAGVARQVVKPEVVSLSGKVLAVETGPCEMSTGRASTGTHFLLETPKGEKLNVHLGPATVVGRIADQLSAGKKVTIKAFRTAKMPEDHYVAKSLAFDGNTIQLRDETFRPFWLGGSAVPRGWGVLQSDPGKGQDPRWGQGPGYGLGARRGYGPGYGQGPARGYGPAYGRGPARGYGPAYGRGPAQGYGPGYGRGSGWGRGAGYGRGSGWGRGAGFGRGWSFMDEDRDGVCDNYERVQGKK